jgi:alpha-glucosidase
VDDLGSDSTFVWTCDGRNGRVLRFVSGSDRLPELPFAAPDAPCWTRSDAAVLRWRGPRFELESGDEPVLCGEAAAEPYRAEFDVGDADVLGFGAATGGSDRNRSRFRIMTRDTLLYGLDGASYTAIPFFVARLGSRVVGVLVATTYPLDVVVESGKVSITGACDTDRTPVDIIVLRGSATEIVCDLAAIVGRSFLPPAWALGFHQSRWSYRTANRVLDIARRFRALELPADVIHLDIHYMDRYRVFTFSPERFPRPQQMHEELRSLGFRTLAIVDPGVSATRYPVHEALLAGDMLLKRSDGSAYEGRVWPGATVFPDFTQQRVRDAWSRFHQPLVVAGVAGFWNDMNDPVFRAGEAYDPLAEDVWHQGVPHRRVRNLYANGMAEATVAGLESLRPGVRPFVLSRSGFLGIQRHAAVWTGDNHSSWEHLRENLEMVVNMGLCGVPLTGADVGGFGRGRGKLGILKPLRPSAELFVRWMELGALMPFFRVHCSCYAPSQEPWSFGRRALELSRRVLRRRYRLLPLLYRLALEANQQGLPIVRPLFMHFDVPTGRGADQFLLGDSILAAPVFHKGVVRREVWLPRGSWVDWYTGEVHLGERSITVDAPLGTTPLFVRAGAALFLAEPGLNSEETLRAPIALEVTTPPAGDVGRGSLFLDDGTCAGGARFILDVSVVAVDGCLQVRFDRKDDRFVPVQRELEVRVPASYATVTVDGERRLLEVRSLAHEDRSATALVTRVLPGAREMLFQ